MTRTTPIAFGATAVLCGALATGIHISQDPSPTTPSAATQHAVTALVTDPPALAARAVPASFEAINGYRPRVQDGHLVDPTGGCSSPIPLPHEFGPVCRQHDLGYDLLRTATATGHALPRSARHRIDQQFAAETRSACDDRSGLSRSTCTVMAGVATDAVELNSWRQHWSDPGQETPITVFAIVAAALAALSVIALAVIGVRELITLARRAFRPSVATPEGVRA